MFIKMIPCFPFTQKSAALMSGGALSYHTRMTIFLGEG
jgi:hypothetical protein